MKKIFSLALFSFATFMSQSALAQKGEWESVTEARNRRSSNDDPLVRGTKIVISPSDPKSTKNELIKLSDRRDKWDEHGAEYRYSESAGGCAVKFDNSLKGEEIVIATEFQQNGAVTKRELIIEAVQFKTDVTCRSQDGSGVTLDVVPGKSIEELLDEKAKERESFYATTVKKIRDDAPVNQRFTQCAFKTSAHVEVTDNNTCDAVSLKKKGFRIEQCKKGAIQKLELFIETTGKEVEKQFDDPVNSLNKRIKDMFPELLGMCLKGRYKLEAFTKVKVAMEPSSNKDKKACHLGDAC